MAKLTKTERHEAGIVPLESNTLAFRYRLLKPTFVLDCLLRHHRADQLPQSTLDQ